MPASQGPLAGRPSWTKDRAGTVVLGYDSHGWAIWSGRQIHPDRVNGYFSESTFDEAQRLTRERHPDQSQFDFQYTSRGLLSSVHFTEDVVLPDGTTDRPTRPLIRETYYDVQGRRVEVVYGDRLCRIGGTGAACDPESPPPGESCDCPEYEFAAGTVETYAYDARQRLSRKRAERSDGLLLLDYRYTYDSSSNIVRVDDEREPYSTTGEDRTVEDFVPYDIEYSYDALNRLARATPIYAEPQPHRVGEQTWEFDALGSMFTWGDETGHFYGWSLGEIVNGLQLMEAGEDDPGVGPLPRVGGVPVDLLGRPVTGRGGVPAPHALYRATGRDDDTLRAYYDAAGNMMALVVHRPRGCERENTDGTDDPAAGGPDGAGCREGDDFRLMFAWDEVGNLLAVERQSLVPLGSCDALGGGFLVLADEDHLADEPRDTVEWCPAARVDNLYDFGGQRRLKHEYPFRGPTRRWPGA